MSEAQLAYNESIIIGILLKRLGGSIRITEKDLREAQGQIVMMYRALNGDVVLQEQP